MRYRKPSSGGLLAMMAVVLICTYQSQSYATVLTPVVFGSVIDNPPDGIGDAIVTFVPGVIDSLPSPPASVARVTSAIVEYDASAFTGRQVKTATLDGTIFANNFLDTGTRTIDILVFSGDGMLSVSDFQVPATSVGSVSYHPPPDRSVSFSLDVTDIVQLLLDGGSNFIGVRFAALNLQAPSQLSASEPPTLALVLEPATLSLLGIGLAGLGFSRRQRKQ